MTAQANSMRGEALLTIGGTPRLLRPSFAALVAAEEELGPLFALVERAAQGQLRLRELAALFWHCLADQTAVTREQTEQAVAEIGLARCTEPLRCLLRQILQGAG